MTSLTIGLIALGLGLVLIVVALAGNQPAPIQVQSKPSQRAERGERRQTARTAEAARYESRPGELGSVLDRLRAMAERLTSHTYKDRLQRKLDLAGNNKAWPAVRVMAFKGAGLLGGGVMGFLIGSKGGITMLAYPLIGGAFGFIVPDILVKNIGQKRQIELRKGLPDALDMMTICVEAGLGFDAAISRVALNLEGPIAAEWARVLQEMQFGKSRSEALRALAARSDVPELRTFVSSLVQAAELGISVGNVLREQAREMRMKRRQRAQEMAQKLPVKILLPLVLCLLPAVFIVVLGPAMLSIVETLGSLNG